VRETHSGQEVWTDGRVEKSVYEKYNTEKREWIQGGKDT
jgi:hypothetical protein